MTSRSRGGRLIFQRLVSRYALVGAVGLLIAVGILFYPALDGWLFYRTATDMLFSILRVALAAFVAGVAFGVVAAFVVSAAVVALGAIFHWPSIRRAVRWSTNGFILFFAFVIGTLFLRNVFSWLSIVGIVTLPKLWRYGLWIALVAIAIVWQRSRSRRSETMTRLDAFFFSRLTRRNVVGLGGASALAVVADAALSNVASGGPRSPARSGAKNVLLVTFDALAAADMSVYGYRLPTTPELAAFARSATVFRQFYSCSTFTTPCVVAFTCGRYPSSTSVYQLSGHLRDEDRFRTLPEEFRKGGYATAASVANYPAHPKVCGIEGFDIAPAPQVDDRFQQACFEARVPQFFTDMLAVRAAMIGKGLPSYKYESPPQLSFAEAKLLWKRLSGPRFLHVHVMAPHWPYTPRRPYLGCFGSGEVDIALIDKYASAPTCAYEPDLQPYFDRLRLRYDEWIAEADAEFGRFILNLDAAGELKDTVVAVSADHGESFEGGIYSHGTGTMLQSIIHVPLLIRRPGQTAGQCVDRVCDAASLAPTLLDLADLPVPQWMDGKSLRWALEAPERAAGGAAFTQYFERNSAFAPIRHGTIGVVEGPYQYVLDVETGAGHLYALEDAHLHTKDISRDAPEAAKMLRERIRSKFPQISIPT